MKKLIYMLILGITLIACDAQIAKGQFDRGEYRESVRTTVSYLSNGKYSSLKAEEKVEIIDRIRIIDNYYRNNINNSSDVYNLKNMYDAFSISHMLRHIPELKNQVNYLTDYNSKNFSYMFEKNLNRNIYNYNSRELAVIYDIVMNMKSNNFRNSGYYSLYKNTAFTLADRYYEIYKKEYNNDKKLEYLEMIYNLTNEFERDYRGVKSKAEALRIKIKIKKADDDFELGKSYYYSGNYERALGYLKEAYDIYDSVLNYSSKASEVRVYIENIQNKLKEETAEKYIRLAYDYASNNDYKKASEYFYMAHNTINNYKGSYNLAKEFETRSNRRKTYRVTSNNSNRIYLIQSLMETLGMREERNKGADLNLNYYETVDYRIDMDYNGDLREMIIINPYITLNSNSYDLKEIVIVNKGNREIGKNNMLIKYSKSINKEIYNRINSLFK